LPELVAREFPDIDWDAVTEPAALLGDAPAQARSFAERVRRL
jgi:hypothetical protein